MKHANVNGVRRAPEPGLEGECPMCGRPVIPKCGELKVWHWAHKGRRICDPWWENETEWHRAWKDLYPIDCQEVVHIDQTSGEKHIADVKTSDGYVIEFQHSFLNPEERRSRNSFYKNPIWVVNGTRRLKDRDQFLRLYSYSPDALPRRPVKEISRTGRFRSQLIEEWVNGSSHVFFDIGPEGGSSGFFQTGLTKEFSY